MTSQTSTPTTSDLSGFAPMIGTALSMIAMLILVAASAVHMMT